MNLYELNQNFNKYCIESKKNVRRFIIKNQETIELIIHLKDAICLDKTNQKKKSLSAQILYKELQKMKRNETPFSLSELNIKGDKIIEMFPNIKVNKIGEILNKLWFKCIDKPHYNSEKTLIIVANQIVNRKKDKYLEV